MKPWVTLLVLLCCTPCKTDDDSEDIDAIMEVLIQMSATQKEQKVELQNTKSQVTAMEVKLAVSEKQVEAVKNRNNELSKELKHLKSWLDTTEGKVVELTTQKKAMAEELKNVNVKYSALEASVEQLKYQKQGMNVAFSAALVGSGYINNIGPLSSRITLAFKHVFTNVGSAYNPSTGIFKAPVRGIYQFLLYVYAPANENYPITTALMKNGHQVLVAHGHTTVKFTANSSNGVYLYLQAGDTVSVQLWENRIVFDNVNCHTTFSGHLLFTV